MADDKSANAWYLDAKRYLDQFPVRTAEEERDYAAEWMGTARSYQAALNDALRQLEGANKDIRALMEKLEVYRQQLAAKDQSWKPQQGIA